MALTAYLTTLGNAAINAAIAAQTALTFSKAEIGTGVCTGESACRARTSLVTKAADAAVSGGELVSGVANIQVQYSNASLTSTLAVNEIALYVDDPANPGTDVLAVYATFGDGTTPDYVYPASSVLQVRVYTLAIAASLLSGVSVTISAAAMQHKITASGLLKGDGAGNITAAVAGTDYAAASHTHALTSSNVTGILPVAKGGTGAGQVGTTLLENLGIVFSETEPSTTDYYIWFKPV